MITYAIGKNFFGTRPQMNSGGRVPGQQPLYRTEPLILLDSTLRFGFGGVPAGTILGRIQTATGGSPDMVPVPCLMAATDLATVQMGVGSVTADVASGAQIAIIDPAISTQYKVGDKVALVQVASAIVEFHDCGAITAINSTTGAITFTTVTAKAWTVTLKAALIHNTGGAAAKGYIKGICLLDRNVDTSTSDDLTMMTSDFISNDASHVTPTVGGTGALISACYGGAVVMLNMVKNRNTNIDTDMMAIVDGRHYIIR